MRSLHDRWNLRREVMVELGEDGGFDLLDPLFQTLVHLTSTHAAALDAGDPDALAALEPFRDHPASTALRREAWYARMRPEPAPFSVDPGADFTAAAAALPWAPAWRDPERWRRFGAAGRAGNRLLPLDGLVPAELVAAARAQAESLPLQRLETQVVSAERAPVDAATGGPLAELWRIFDHGATRDVIGHALRRALPGRLHLNVWRLGPGDRMAVHPDGPRYAATLILGLEPAWTVADGGAVAFGTPTERGLTVAHRWLPHAGDALVFAPAANTWHAVEPPARPRFTLSGWWMAS